MADTLLTDRLMLVPVGAEQVDDLVLLHGDPRIAFWNAGSWSRGDAERYAAAMAERWLQDGIGKWMAYLRSTGALVGRGGFTRTTLAGEEVLELGWAVRDELTGRGFATEIGSASIAWAGRRKPAPPPIVSFTEQHNAASIAVMRRLGMQPVGVIRRPGLEAGRVGLQPRAPFAVYRLPAPTGAG